MSFHQHCSLKHTIGQSQGEGVQLFYSFKITTTSIILYCPRPVSLCLDFFSVPPFFFFFLWCLFLFLNQNPDILFVYLLLSSLCSIPLTSFPSFILLSWHWSSEINPHCVFLSTLFCFFLCLSLACTLRCQRHLARNPSTVQEHAHIRWHRVTPVQCKNLCWCDQCRSCYWQTAIFPR